MTGTVVDASTQTRQAPHAFGETTPALHQAENARVRGDIVRHVQPERAIHQARPTSNSPRRATGVTSSHRSQSGGAASLRLVAGTTLHRRLLNLLRLVPRSGPIPAQKEEIEANFAQAQRNYNRIRASNHSAAVKEEARRKLADIEAQTRRLARCSSVEHEKVARYVNRARESSSRAAKVVSWIGCCVVEEGDPGSCWVGGDYVTTRLFGLKHGKLIST